MYIQCMLGFIEADRWDGTEIPIKSHMRAIDKLQMDSSDIFVLRSRSERTLGMAVQCIVGGKNNITRPVLASPRDWDYEWRVYVSAKEFALIMSNIIDGTQYRNFKKWCGTHSKGQSVLAHDIWHAAHKNGGAL